MSRCDVNHPTLVTKLTYLADRIWAAVKRESISVVSEGVAEPSDVDALLRDIIGTSSGPFQAMDRIGLDVVLDIEEHYLAVHPELGREAADLLRRYVSEGKLGVKTGEGIYKHPRGQPHAEDHLIYLDVVNGQIISGTVDGKQTKTLISGLSNRPDGVQLDPKAGKLYWTCMGRSPNDNDGSVMSANLDGSDIVEIVPVGKTFTAKQNYLDVTEQTLYWCDREGGRIQS